MTLDDLLRLDLAVPLYLAGVVVADEVGVSKSMVVQAVDQGTISPAAYVQVRDNRVFPLFDPKAIELYQAIRQKYRIRG